VSFNIFTLTQTKSFKYNQDDDKGGESCAGKIEIDSKNNQLKWTLYKKDVDLIFKEHTIAPNFRVSVLIFIK
jgi:hypothetical protein